MSFNKVNCSLEYIDPLSYTIDTDVRIIPSAHIQLLKRFVRENDSLKVERATAVLEPDSLGDCIDDRYAEVRVKGDELEMSQKRDIDRILEEFKETVTSEPGLTDRVEFSINTGDSAPIAQRPYNTPIHFRDSIDKEIDWLIEKKYIRRSTSAWASPIVCVRKPDGSARLCVDYKRLNSVTVLSKMNLAKGYYQIRVNEKDVEKTTFVCHRGKFEFSRMPFGVMNTPAIFQELMQEVLKEDVEYCSPYMDDVTVYSETWEDHLEHIRRVLGRLQSAGLTANPKKCQWGGQMIEFLGHQVGNGRMSLPSHRAEAFKRYTKPSTKKSLKAFLGAIGFYHRYVQRLANYTAVLTPLTSKAAPSKVVWSREGERAFVTICTIISDACSLCIPLPNDEFSIVTDASGLGIGSVLQVWRENEWQAAAFYSRQLRGPEHRYSATELEALALVSSVEHFGYYLYGKTFQVFTDHKPLLQLTTSEKLNPRLQRMAYKLQHWLLKISYLPGPDSTFADALSREERGRDEKRTTGETPDVHLAGGDVAGDPPRKENNGCGKHAPQEKK